MEKDYNETEILTEKLKKMEKMYFKSERLRTVMKKNLKKKNFKQQQSEN